MIDATIFWLCLLLARSATKLRSIFISSTGSSFRWLSEENPVPKSSIDRRTPSARIARSWSAVPSTFSIIALSVISIFRQRGGTPLAASASRIVGTSDPLRSCRSDTFTATAMSQRPQSASWRQACRIIRLPSSTMSPDSSATGMNWSGKIIGPSGGCQRISASKPARRRLPASTSGW